MDLRIDLKSSDFSKWPYLILPSTKLYKTFLLKICDSTLRFIFFWRKQISKHKLRWTCYKTPNRYCNNKCTCPWITPQTLWATLKHTQVLILSPYNHSSYVKSTQLRAIKPLNEEILILISAKPLKG